MGIIELLIIVVFFIALVTGIVLWITGGGSKGSCEMSCGGCGYAVRGLEALNCPECGADLRMVGINQPKGSALRIVGMVMTLGSLLLLLTCLGSAVFLVNQSTSFSPVQAVPTQTTAPPATSTQDAELEASEDGERDGTATPEAQENDPNPF